MTPVSIKQKTFILLAFVVVGFLIYSNTFDASFHFDDEHVVSDLTFEEMLERCKMGSSRVVAHLTFLFNYWLGGADVFGYHLLNTLIHIGTAFFVFLFLYQILSLANRLERFEQIERFERLNRSAAQPNPPARRLLPPLRDPLFWPPFWGGLLFLVHPLATQSVTYITQRYTSLAGFFYIGSLVFLVFARIKLRQGRRFLKAVHVVPYVFSFVMAVLAMRTKEVAITLPAAVLLTEYSFIQSDFREAGKRILYLLPLLSTALIIPASNILGVETISLENLTAIQDYTWAPEITRTEYLLTQFKVIIGIYLKLMFWPIGQNIDHDYVISKTLLDPPTMASFLALCVLFGIGLWLFKRARLVSFGILWFFVTISPTSSLVPNNEFVAEHRVYISLVGLAFATASLPAWQRGWKYYLAVLTPILLLLCGLTYVRNRVWHTDLTLWTDSLANSVKKARPHNNMGNALAKRERLGEAASHYSVALQLESRFVEAHNNLGNILVMQGHVKDAVRHYSQALAYRPDFADAHYNIGIALAQLGRPDDAIAHYSEVARIRPYYADAYYNMGNLLHEQGQLVDAIEHYSKALQIKTDNADAHNNLGNALQQQGRLADAIEHYSKALQIRPGSADTHYNMGVALSSMGRGIEAISHYSEAARVKPDDAKTWNNLAVALTSQGRVNEAVIHYSRALQLSPGNADMHYNLGNALVKMGSLGEAVSHYSMALEITPDFPQARNNLELALGLMQNSLETPGGK